MYISMYVYVYKYVCMYISVNFWWRKTLANLENHWWFAKFYQSLVTSRRAVVSHEAKKKQHAYASSGQCDHCSELFTGMDSLKF